MPNGEAPSGAHATPARAWQKLTKGLPGRDAHVGVLREGMVADEQDDFGLYSNT